MSQHLSVIGIIHTVISFVPLIAGLYAMIRFSFINQRKRSGKIFFTGLVLSVLTSFGVSSTGGLNVGHLFGVFILIISFSSFAIPHIHFLGGLKAYISTFLISFSYFLSWVPGINETLTRLPVANPLADSPQSPVVLKTLLVFLGLFLIGFGVQCRQIFLKK